MNENERIRLLSEAETGPITDSMNLIGIGDWMDGILPISKNKKVCGRALTVQYSECKANQRSYMIYEILDIAKPGDIIVISSGSNGAIVGEKIMHAMLNLKLGGMVLYGMARDYGHIKKMGIPLFVKGRSIRMAPANHKITDYNVPITCGCTQVKPGDYIVGDIDGVIVLKEEDVDNVLFQLEKVIEIEKRMDLALQAGCTMREFMVLSKSKKIPRTQDQIL